MFKSFCIFILPALFVCNVVRAADSEAGIGGSTVVAEIDGEKLTLQDFEQKRSMNLFQARNTYYNAQRQVLEQFIDEYLLEKQAQRENLSVAQLLDRHIVSVLPKDPPEEALKLYYEGTDANESFEVARDKIRDYIRQRRMAKAKAEYIKSLRSQSKVVLSFSQPKADIRLNDTPVRGPISAPVVLVEYADYECPYCQQVHADLAKLEAEYKGKLAFAFKDYPLPMHANAQKAAEAAQCAGVQGKYWEYHDRLFEVKRYDLGQLKNNARTLNLDAAAFDKCLDSGASADAVKAHLAEAQGLGLQGTPTFFLNGRVLSGAVNYETLRQAVEEELAATATRLASSQRKETGATGR
jgi:protein-disulfide isomerase